MREESPVAMESEWIRLKEKDRLTRHFDRLINQAEEVARKYNIEKEEYQVRSNLNGKNHGG